jgi:hypothetical protein
MKSSGGRPGGRERIAGGGTLAVVSHIPLWGKECGLISQFARDQSAKCTATGVRQQDDVLVDDQNLVVVKVGGRIGNTFVLFK